jgi:CubicO group peptidase (beta-lactamase class C family)
LAIAVAATFCAVTSACAQPSAQGWIAYVNPAEAGFSAERLEQAREFADANRAGAVVVVRNRRVVAAWGAIDRPFNVHSIRKSLAGALYGAAVRDGQLSLEDTLDQLQLQDDPPLDRLELGARFVDLISSRSGIYHGAAYASGEQEQERPERGSHAPGTFWYYNNWDFNAAETAYEHRAGESIYAAFNRKIARPLGMEDFDPENQLAVLEPSQSRLPAHTFRMSARDLARFGQLYLDGGQWNGAEIIPREWVEESFRPHSQTGDGTGYGYLWWTYAAASLASTDYPQLSQRDIYLARGSGGQALFIIPAENMVVVHLADTDNGRTVRGPQIWQLVERIMDARTGEPSAQATPGPLIALPLASNVPPPPPLPFQPLDTRAMQEVVGDYTAPDGVSIRVFAYETRLFINAPGQGEAELFAVGRRRYAPRVIHNAEVFFEGAGGAPAPAMTLTRDGTTIQAVRAAQTAATPSRALVRRYGLSIAPPSGQERSLTIQQVAEGGVAATAGILPGDEVHSLNGTPVSQISRDEFGRLMRSSPLRVALTRNGVEHVFELSLD